MTEKKAAAADMQALWNSSYLGSGNTGYLDGLYEDYLRDPGAVPGHWREYFDRLPPLRPDLTEEVSHSEVRAYFRDQARHPRQAAAPCDDLEHERKQVRVLQLINAYRFRGHQQARVDPLNLKDKPSIPDLTLRHHQLSELDLDTVFDTGSLIGPDKAPLKDIVEILSQTYCASVGAEYMHITETAEKRWLQQRLESAHGRPGYPDAVRRHILERLTAAEGLERYLHARYVGQKRFSLEGAESLIPLLDELVHRAGSYGVKELVIGMAHRGRLNVLVNILGKTPSELFDEFEGRKHRGRGTGDVKYHLGFSSDINTPGGPLHLALAFNPSHLEIVGPVVEGSVRARQERRGDASGEQVVPVVLHGDAAFAGQGVVMETLNMSQSRGFSTKGTVHVVINNQIGFTTSKQEDARSTYYCTDVAKMVGAPILHVNGDDPEAVILVTQLALDYRITFNKDVVIDLVCYRRHGHNEADEPAATQPAMYSRIKAHPTTRQIYGDRLIRDGVIEVEQASAMGRDYRDALDSGQCVVPDRLSPGNREYAHAVNWKPFLEAECGHSVETAVSLERIRELAEAQLRLPPEFELNPRVANIMENRRKMAAGAIAVDWGFAETMAYATLLREGYGVRLSGQDTGRGTFFHRHAVLHNQRDGNAYVPLRNLHPQQGRFLVIDSLLSEEAVLAFEYGYATADPNSLVVWEAQFGDFANGAQVVIDQFISSGEQKWGRLCGLTLLLPHGYEGQGPEHSSARLERYLQLCAQHNFQVCVPTTPAQVFHLLRRQMHSGCRKPLAIMSPKSLLRHKLASNALEDLTSGGFRNVLGEHDPLRPREVKRVVLCSGKVYFDLLQRRREMGAEDIAIVRIEQLYPFPRDELAEELARYSRAQTFVWCQEEPLNQGAWYTSQHNIRGVLGKKRYLRHICRPESASPAVGDPGLHAEQQRELVDRALFHPFGVKTSVPAGTKTTDRV